MLRFFSKIRKSTLDEGKAGKYLKYAIGEIFLVVVGILIALQINNWNEEQKEGLIEVSLIKKILSDLKETHMSLKEDIEINQRGINSNNIITEALTNSKNYESSFDQHFGNVQYNSQFTISSGGYEQLKTTGFEVISNNEIREVIIDIHDRWYDFVHRLNDKNDIMSIQQFDPQYQKHFSDFSVQDTLDARTSFKPRNYNNLKGNKEFLHLLSVRKFNNEVNIHILKNANALIEEAATKLEAELERLN